MSDYEEFEEYDQGDAPTDDLERIVQNAIEQFAAGVNSGSTLSDNERATAARQAAIHAATGQGPDVAKAVKAAEQLGDSASLEQIADVLAAHGIDVEFGGWRHK